MPCSRCFLFSGRLCLLASPALLSQQSPPVCFPPTFLPALGFHLLGLPICLSVHLPSPTHAVAKAQLPGTTHILPLQFGEAGAGTFDRSVVGRPRAGGLVGEGCGLWGTGRLVLAEQGGSQASEPGIPWPHEVSRPMLGRAAAGRPSQSSEAPEGGGLNVRLAQQRENLPVPARWGGRGGEPVLVVLWLQHSAGPGGHRDPDGGLSRASQACLPAPRPKASTSSF